MSDVPTTAPTSTAQPRTTPMQSAPAARERTTIDAIADRYVAQVVAASPMTATHLGVPGSDHLLDDFSPAGLAAEQALRVATLAELDAATPQDAVDRVTLDAMRERLGLAGACHEAGLDHMSLNVLASPLQSVREILDLMPTASAADWANICARLEAMDTALSGWHDSLLVARDRGRVSPRRQVLACIEQCERLVGDDGYFAALPQGEGAPDPASREGTRLADAARAGARAYASVAERLTRDILPHAPEDDAIGVDLYRLCSRRFVGAEVDLAETYAWGQNEVRRIMAQMAAVAERIRPGATVPEAIAALDADPAYLLHGTDALQEWMQTRAEEAIDALDGRFFDIPEPLRTIECRIAPTDSGAIYYTGPSEDFGRPGRMWWSVPPGVTEFSTWRELTTVYHEGVPGHHLQVAQAIYRRDNLNRWRRTLAWTSGHGEGWALYAERLMAEFGFLDDPGMMLGLLDGQSLRAARVVIDIGVHCRFEAPDEVGGGPWTYEKAWQYLSAHANMADAFLRFELDRYLGWPGQAPAYKIGERIWEQLRAEVTAQAAQRGEAFDLKDFHRRALDLGGLGLDTLRRAVLEEL